MPDMKTAKLTFNPHNQNLDTIHKVVASIIGKAGCLKCGRLLNIDFQFLVDPGPDFSHEGVVSVQTEGF